VHLPYIQAIIARFSPFVKGGFPKKSPEFSPFFTEMVVFPARVCYNHQNASRRNKNVYNSKFSLRVQRL